MGRKSKLSEKQWADIQRRVLEGESVRALAKEYGIAESSLRGKISVETAQIKIVANQIVSTERAIQALPISAQITAHSLASKLRSISDHLAAAANYGAATAHRLSALANAQIEKIDDADPMSTADVLRGAAALTSVANESGKMGLNLLAANKDKKFGEEEKPAMTLDDFYGGTKSQPGTP